MFAESLDGLTQIRSCNYQQHYLTVKRFEWIILKVLEICFTSKWEFQESNSFGCSPRLVQYPYQSFIHANCRPYRFCCSKKDYFENRIISSRLDFIFTTYWRFTSSFGSLDYIFAWFKWLNDSSSSTNWSFWSSVNFFWKVSCFYRVTFCSWWIYD